VEKSVFTPEYRVLLDLLRSERRRNGITQVVAAERLHLTQSFYSKCERGEHRLDVLELMHICEVIGIDFMEFMRQLRTALGRPAGG